MKKHPFDSAESDEKWAHRQHLAFQEHYGLVRHLESRFEYLLRKENFWAEYGPRLKTMSSVYEFERWLRNQGSSRASGQSTDPLYNVFLKVVGPDPIARKLAVDLGVA